MIARYDGHAEWYDETFYPEEEAFLRECVCPRHGGQLGPGEAELIGGDVEPDGTVARGGEERSAAPGPCR